MRGGHPAPLGTSVARLEAGGLLGCETHSPVEWSPFCAEGMSQGLAPAPSAEADLSEWARRVRGWTPRYTVELPWRCPRDLTGKSPRAASGGPIDLYGALSQGDRIAASAPLG